MRSSLQLVALSALPIAQVSAEKVLGAYVFARHGDRTAKILDNTQLTDLGYNQVYTTGSSYHDRYINSSSSQYIQGISEQIVDLSQLTSSVPADAVLQNSATGFLQGVYPPAGSASSQELADGTKVESPLNGYQLIPLSLIDSGSSSEDSAWLQSTTDCQNAIVSSDNYYSSELYNELLDSTRDFYRSLSSLIDTSFSESDMNFKNAYSIFDYLNVGYIHNTTNVPTEDQLQQAFLLANIEQYNLAYNSSETVRAIAGSTLAAEMLMGLNETVTSKGDVKLHVEFGSYGTFLSYFGLAQLPAADLDFTGIPDYASSMVWELVTNSTADSFPDPSEISVRFAFHNGTLTESGSLTEYPLYGQSSATIPWSTFVEQTEKIAVMTTEQFCEVCGNTDGQCASSSSSSGSDSDSASADSASTDDRGISRSVAGVIGAMVTLAVILGLQALFFLVGGFRITKKGQTAAAVAQVAENKPA
ncbi:histidine phosphatase superfamily [Aspergillus lucknowensis]|uniref:Histidine phosphatase superfamily n=1 Tax=Aspergillus lucknowensis TaxID=176173 RepID=A0ABR4LKK9_9EURO